MHSCFSDRPYRLSQQRLAKLLQFLRPGAGNRSVQLCASAEQLAVLCRMPSLPVTFTGVRWGPGMWGPGDRPEISAWPLSDPS